MRITAVVAASFVVAASSTVALAAEEITFGISAKPGSLQQVTSAEFTKRANENLAAGGHDYEVVLYDSAQIGDDKEMMQKLKIGSQHLSLPSSIMSSISGAFGVFDMPFIIKDREHLAKMEESVFWSDIAPTVEEQGYQVLAVWENGVRQITNNVRPINTPADLAGIKLRTPKSTWRIKMFTEWGANPTPMAFSEVFVALQTGVIDGQENPLTQHRLGQVPGGAEVSVDDRPRLFAGLPDGQRQGHGGAAGGGADHLERHGARDGGLGAAEGCRVR